MMRAATTLALVALAGFTGTLALMKMQSDDRVPNAYRNALPGLKQDHRRIGVPFPPARMFLRAFKQDEVLEVWCAGKEGPYKLLATYTWTANSGTLGPKRKEGDKQIPEGFYEIVGLNPRSSYHLSLRLNYPNASDRILSDRQQPGSDIMIHGKAVTIGCIPIGDENVEHLFVLASEVRKAGGSIPVHIFPTRLDESGLSRLEKRFAARPDLLEFWRNLSTGYRKFEDTRSLPRNRVEADGSYRFD